MVLGISARGTAARHTIMRALDREWQLTSPEPPFNLSSMKPSFNVSLIEWEWGQRVPDFGRRGEESVAAMCVRPVEGIARVMLRVPSDIAFYHGLPRPTSQVIHH